MDIHCTVALVALSHRDARQLPWHPISTDSGQTKATMQTTSLRISLETTLIYFLAEG